MSKQLKLLACFLILLVFSGSALVSLRVSVKSSSSHVGNSNSEIVDFVDAHDQCRMWGMVSPSFPESVVMDQLVNLPDSLKNLGGGPDGPGNVDGWGLVYFSSGAPVVVRGQPQAYTDNNFNIAAQQLAASDKQVGMGHVRNAASGAKNIPDPHPFIRERGGKSWVLAHNGVLNKDNLKSLIGSTYLSYFTPAVGSDWNDPDVVDSDLYLIYVVKCIEESGWDVKRGVAKAETEIYRTDSSANANFLLSDGNEMWGYKKSVDSAHPLNYKYDSVSGYSAIVSQPPEGPGLGNWISMSNFNLVEISVGAAPVLYQDIRDYEVTFAATELLGRPTDTSITVNVVPSANGQVYFKYGTSTGVYTGQTSIAALTSGTPIEVVMQGLTPNTRYYYRMVSSSDGTNWVDGDEHSFHTQRAPGSTFTFTIISDSHMNGGGGNVALYQQTLNNVLADNPDFHLDLGDTFWMDGVTSSTTANQRYLQQRQYMGTISHSASIFVATGNHENEEGWNFDDTNSKALLSVNARKLYYPNPIPDSFYTGNTDDSLTAISGDHLREDYYAWQWGDALFVVIDPFQYTMVKPYAGSPGGEDNDETVIGDRWDWTLGQQQFNWFKQTLENSDATFKFVFAHHMVGGSQDYVRGGAGPAYLFEWGGYNADGTTWGFNTERPGWGNDPIHQLMVANGVTAFFHGHDHEYAKEERDGIVYQLCPMPSDSSYGYGFNLYHESDPYTDVVLPNSGHLRVTVSPSQVTVDYVRAYLPGQGTNGQVAYTYTIMARALPESPLLLTVTPNQASYMKGQSVTLTVNVFNQLNPPLESTLTLTVTGPNNYYDFDFQPINVSADTVGEYSFTWVIPDVAGAYVVEVELVPPQLTAYDAAWLEVA